MEASVRDAIDPVTLVVVQNGLQQVASEMDLTFERAAFSPVISEGFDRSDGIYAKDNGEVIAQGELGLPIFVGVMQFTTRAVIDHVRESAEALRPGDIFIVNDPYCGGTHLMDVKMVKPFFYRGKLWAFLSNTGHWPDTGGSVPGGFSTRATEVQQEGLRLPPVKLYREGVMQPDILSIILANIRVPEERIGDIKAQTAGLTVGEKRLTALIDRYGETTVSACIAELRRRSEQMMRAHIAKIPDGVYAGEAFVDSDGVDPDPLAIRLRLRVDGTDLHFDFSESSPPCRGPLNSVIATTKAAVYLAIKHGFPDVPINAGCFLPLHIADPHGTFLYARYPRPVSGCAAEVSSRIAESIFTTLGQAIPDDLFAAPAGTSGNLTLGGHDPLKERHYIMYIFSGGGYGGSAGGRPHQRLLHHRYLEDAARGGAGAALPDPLRALRAARAIGGRGRDAGRLRRGLQDPHPPRRGAALFPDGPRPLRTAWHARRRGRRPQRGDGRASRRRVCVPPPVEGRGHPGGRGGHDHGAHAGRRRLRRPVAARPRSRRSRRGPRVYHRGRRPRRLRRGADRSRRGHHGHARHRRAAPPRPPVSPGAPRRLTRSAAATRSASSTPLATATRSVTPTRCATPGAPPPPRRRTA